MIERRNFLKLAGSTAAVVLAMARRVFAADQGRSSAPYQTLEGPDSAANLGKTGERVSIVGIGGHHLGRALVEESESIRIVRTALDSGVNFLDNSWDYNDGEQRNARRKGVARWLSRQSICDDENRRTRQNLSHQTDRRLAAAAADRSDRPGAVSRGDPDERPGSNFRERRRYRSDARREKSRQAAIHRLHRPQESSNSSSHAADRR